MEAVQTFSVRALDSQWVVQFGDQTLARFTDQPSAVQEARDLAKMRQPSHVVLLNERGAVEREFFFDRTLPQRGDSA